MTPPGGNNGLAQDYTCNDGMSMGTSTLSQGMCANDGGLWQPDLVKQEMTIQGKLELRSRRLRETAA